MEVESVRSVKSPKREVHSAVAAAAAVVDMLVCVCVCVCVCVFIDPADIFG